MRVFFDCIFIVALQSLIDGREKTETGSGVSGAAGGTLGGSAPITPTPQTNNPASPSYSTEIQDTIKQLAEVQKQNKIASLTSMLNSSFADLDSTYNRNISGLDTSLSNILSQYEKGYQGSMSGLDTQQGNVKNTFYDKRNQAAADSDVGQYNFAQYMASRGIKGNQAAMPEIYRNVGLQNRLGALGQQEAQINADIENQRQLLTTNYNTDTAAARAERERQAAALAAELESKKNLLNTNYLSDLEAAKAAIDAQALENYINQMNADRSFSANQANNQFEQEFALKKYADSLLQQEKDQFSKYVNAYYNDFQAEINRVQNDGDPSNDWQIPILQNARNQKLAEQAAAQNTAEQTAYDRWLDQQKLNSKAKSGGATADTYAALNDDTVYTGYNPPPVNTKGPEFYRTYNYAQTMKLTGNSPDEITMYVANEIGKSISKEQALEIARVLGLPIQEERYWSGT